MMMKSSSVIGRPICLMTGKQLAAVKLVVFDPEQHSTLGFVVDWGGWAGSAKILPLSAEVKVAEKAIVIPSAHLIVPVDQVPHIRRMLEGPSLSKGTVITTTDGYMIGVLHDVYFDAHSTAIHDYEVVFTQSSAAGQYALLTPDQVTFDPSVPALVVPTELIPRLQESVRDSD